MFSLIYAVLLRPVPYADWQRLTYPIYLNDDQPTSPERWFSLTWSQYQQLLKANCMEDALGDDSRTSEITGRDIPEEVTLTYITENASSFLRVPALLGRNIQPSDAEAAQQQAPVVLNYDFWMRHYNGDRNVLGKTLELDHKPYSIVGVCPKLHLGTRPLRSHVSAADARTQCSAHHEAQVRREPGQRQRRNRCAGPSVCERNSAILSQPVPHASRAHHRPHRLQP